MRVRGYELHVALACGEVKGADHADAERHQLGGEVVLVRSGSGQSEDQHVVAQIRALGGVTQDMLYVRCDLVEFVVVLRLPQH